MISDLTLADLSLAAYTEPATIETDDVHALLRDVDGILVIALRGTNPWHFVDLWRDLSAIAVRHDPIFGAVSESFFADAEQLVWRLWPLLTGPYALTGHSKAGPEAQAAAAMLTHMGRPPIRLSVFEPAQLGTLGGAVAGLPGIATRLGEDPVTQAPENRGHAQPLTLLPWSGGVVVDPLEYHAMAAVREAVVRHVGSAQ